MEAINDFFEFVALVNIRFLEDFHTILFVEGN
jgi:hypothetical protein